MEDIYEFNIFDQFKIVWKQKVFAISLVIISCVFSVVYAFLSDKVYESRTSFVIDSSISSGGSFSKYSRLLGVNEGQNVESYIKSIIKSDSIRRELSRNYIDYFSVEIKEVLDEETSLKSKDEIQQFTEMLVIDLLDLESSFYFTLNRDGLFELFYSFRDKHIVKSVLDEYVNQIILFNENLDFLVQKKIIQVIDYAETPLFPKSRLILNLILTFVISFFVSIGLILSYHYFFIIKKKIKRG
tara:strand:+ start:724 stop:1449 length:726 start_codon:yes stop_codon:yes gene_type:complete